MHHIHLSPADAIFLNDDYPIEFVFFYPSGLDAERVRAAMRALSSVFWPPFAEYRDGALHQREYDENLYIQAVRNTGVFALTAGAAHEVEALAALRAPEDTGGFLSLRLVQFDNGTALVTRMSHLAGDAYSFLHFLTALARATASGKAEPDVAASRALPTPKHDRTALRRVEPALCVGSPRHAQRALSVRFEALPRAFVHDTVRAASRASGVPISINDLLAARALKHTIELSAQEADCVELTIPIDVRSLVPEYGPAYFGNGLWLHRCELTRDQVIRAELAELALLVRRAMPAIEAASYGAHLDQLAPRAGLPEGTPRAYDPARGCMVSNASQLPTSLLDFGTGAPAQVFPVMKERMSAIILADKSGYQLRFAY